MKTRFRFDLSLLLGIAWLAIAIALQIQDGRFHPVAIALVVFGGAIIVIAARSRLVHRAG